MYHVSTRHFPSKWSKHVHVNILLHQFPGCWIARDSLIVDPGETQRCGMLLHCRRFSPWQYQTLGELDTTKNLVSRLLKNFQVANTKSAVTCWNYFSMFDDFSMYFQRNLRWFPPPAKSWKHFHQTFLVEIRMDHLCRTWVKVCRRSWPIYLQSYEPTVTWSLGVVRNAIQKQLQRGAPEGFGWLGVGGVHQK